MSTTHNRRNAMSLYSATIGAAIALMLLGITSARADARWWDGTTDANWSTAANWFLDPTALTPAAVPTSGEDVFFNATGTIANPIGFLNGSQGAKSLTFTNNATIGADGSTLTVASGTVSAGPAVTGTLNCTVAGTAGLTKLGSGLLALGGANTYSGNTLVSNGVLAVDNDGALSSGTLVLAGGEIRNAGTTPRNLANALSLTNNPIIGGAGDLTFSVATINLGTAIRTWTINNASNTTLSGSLTNTAGLIKTGSGPLTLSGNNTYRGATTNLAGMLVLSGSNTCSGGLVIAGGAVRLDNVYAALSNSVTVNASNGLVFGSGIAVCTVGALGGSAPLGLTNVVGGAVTVTNGGNNASTTYWGSLSGSGGLVKIGTGTLTLGGGTADTNNINTYTGLTWVKGGTLLLSKYALNTNAIGGDLLITDGATVKYAALGSNREFSGEKIADWASVTVSNASWNLLAAGGDYSPETISNLTLYASAVTNSGHQSGTKLQMNGSTILNAGSAILMGASQSRGNTFQTTALVLSGGSTISATCGTDANMACLVNGLFTVNQPSAGAYTAVSLKATYSAARSSYLSLGSNLVFNGDAANTNATIFAVDPASTYPASCSMALTGLRTFTVNAGGAPVDLVVQPRITGVGFLKMGNGTLQLLGANVHTNTTVNQGRLLVDGSLSGTSNVIVNAGGTLGGTGVVNRTVVVNAGGILEPGSLGLGTLSATNLTLAVGAICNYELGAIGASDRVVVTNALTLRGTINIARAPGFKVGRYEIMSYGTLAANTAVIGSVPQGFSATLVDVPANKKIYVDIREPTAILFL